MRYPDPALAYREQDARDLCASCGAFAGAPCPRCASPLCAAHAPGDDRRCDACELAYLSRETGTVSAIVVRLIVGAVLLGGAGAFATHMARNGFIHGTSAQIAPLIPSLAGMLFILAFALAPWLRRRLRARFLRERVRTARQA